MSSLFSRWRLRDLTLQSSAPSHYSLLLQRLLSGRGLREESETKRFLEPDFYNDTHDPFLFRDMTKAVRRIREALAANEYIGVFADYDADGVCSAAVLTTTLERFGHSRYSVYLPHREHEGYGLQPSVIDQFAERGARLLITLDCGTTNHNEIALAKERGIDVIVVDHHYVAGEPPAAYAFLNAKLPGETYPFPHLASVGVTYKLAQALLRDAAAQDQGANQEEISQFEKWLLDYVAIATVTDLVPLTGENRVLLRYGLIVLNKTPRPGLSALIAVCGKRRTTIDAEYIAFQLGPRLNAASRVAHASLAYDLLVATSAAEAERLAAALDEANRNRRRMTETVTSEAVESLRGPVSNDGVLVAVGTGWPIGLVGLVASRLMEQYRQPVLVVTRAAQGLVGSGRSTPEFNIIEALHTRPELFTKFGGHAQACGFTLPDDASLELLHEALNHALQQARASKEPAPDLELDASLELSAIDNGLHEELRLLEPFGMENRRPIFLVSGVTVVGLSVVGGGKHLRLTLTDGQGTVKSAIGFRMAPLAAIFTLGDHVDVAAEIVAEDWNGARDIRLRLIDVRRSIAS